jgi:hypothetical protein
MIIFVAFKDKLLTYVTLTMQGTMAEKIVFESIEYYRVFIEVLKCILKVQKSKMGLVEHNARFTF